MKHIVTLPPLSPRPADGQKGQFGRVLVVGGNDAMVGAPVLAGTAALRMGAGLVQIAVPKTILAAAISITPELIGLPLRAGNLSELVGAADKADVVVIGPGLGQKPDAKKRLMKLVRMKKPMLVDADGLNLLAAEKKWPAFFKAHAVLTPHPGEMKRLAKLFNRSDVPSDDEGRIQIATLAAKTFGQLIVLKGHRTIVTDGEKIYLNRTGDSSLSKAGSGDVLSGIIGALFAQMEHFDAACAGVWLHGKAGEIAGKKLGRRSVLARDVIDALPEAIRSYDQQHGVGT
jgi:NAD(P)H-hydrate epimerase